MEDSYSVFLERIVRKKKISYLLLGVGVDGQVCDVSHRTSKNFIFFTHHNKYKISLDVLMGFVNKDFQQKRYPNNFLQSEYNSFLIQMMTPRLCRYCSKKINQKDELFFNLHYTCSCKIIDMVERKIPEHVWDNIIAQKI